MTKNVVRLAIALLVLIGLSSSAYAQGATSSIVGTVVDATGGVVPGATVIVKNEATQESYETVSGTKGEFVIPALNVGSYSITVTLTGFKTFLAKGVNVTTGSPASVKATLEVGGLEQTVTVEAAAAMVQTTTSSVASTVDLKQISMLPLVSRNALDFITFLPGVQTAGGSRDSHVNGLPQSTLNITIDGLNVQDNYLKSSDGFFARMSPRLDAVEEVTVTSAASGADASGQGATQIKFTTRSGANRFNGSVYHYFQNDRLNTNTYFLKRDQQRDLDGKLVDNKAKITLNQYGARFGGAIVIPGLFDGHNKAFFFINYEEVRQPNTSTLNRTILSKATQSGIFSYVGGAPVNVLALAASKGQLATPDPVVAKLLADIRASTLTTGTIFPIAGDLLRERFTWQTPVSSLNRFPTVRADYNLTDRHKLNASFNWNDINARPDTTNSRQPLFPGFPVVGDQISDRYTIGGSLRSTFGKNMVNEFRVGGTGGATLFSPGLNIGMYTGATANQLGYQIGIGPGISAASFGSTPSSREASTKVVEDTLTWLKGSHNITTGFNMTQVDLWLKNQTMTPTLTLDVLSTDTAAFSMFTVANFPGATSGELQQARQLYATLVGKVSNYGATARLDESTGEYVANGQGIARGRQREFDFFLQDNWRVRPDLSLNLGVRYVAQLPFYSKNSSYSTATLADAWGMSGYKDGCPGSDPSPELCNLFKATINSQGTTGIKPTYSNLAKGTKAFNPDWDNIAPSIGINWTPSVSGGWLKKMMGEQGDTAFRAGFARSFSRQGIGDYSGVFGDNPGASSDASRTAALGTIPATGLLLRNESTLTPGAFASKPVYPRTPLLTESINMFDPNLQVPYSDSWTVGVQRSLGRKMAVEVRYVGTRSRDQWTEYNYNEPNILDNGFLTEFKSAQANLQNNIAAGRGVTFKHFANTNTVPLPIYLAYFSGVNPSQAGNAALYTSSNWQSTSFINALTRFGSNPFTPAGTSSANGLSGDPTRRANALAAGLPANFFRANPDVASANVTGYGGYTKYNSIQTEFRRRLSDGLQVSANYVLGHGESSSRYSFRVPRILTRQTGQEGDVTHAFKATYVYDLPFGQGRRFGSSVGSVADRIIGGWNFSGTARIQSGRLVDFGNIRTVGFEAKDVQKMFKLRKSGDCGTFPSTTCKLWMLPEDIILQTIKAFSTSPSTATGYGTGGPPSGQYFAPANGPDCIESIANGYGDCGERSLVVTGPILKRFDMSLTKQIRLTGRGMFEFRIDVLNVFEAVQFSPTNGIGSTTVGGYEVTGTGDNNGRRVFQLVSRITW